MYPAVAPAPERHAGRWSSPVSRTATVASYPRPHGPPGRRTDRRGEAPAAEVRGWPARLPAGVGLADNGMVIEVAPDRFEEMVVEALDGLPDELGQMMQNVAVTVEHGAGPPGLLGLYQGIPLTSRTSYYAGGLPDPSTIYHQAICAICRAPDEVVDQGRRTVLHEVAHPFR